MTQTQARTIRTSFINPPIPVRNFDWQAWYADDEEGHRGHGATEQAAIAHLEELNDINAVPPIQMLGELRPGATYAFRLTERLPLDILEKYTKAFSAAMEGRGMKFILFGPELEQMNGTELGEVVRAEIKACMNAFSDSIIRGAPHDGD